MRRAVRPGMYLGVACIVFALAKVHAQFIGHYDLTGSGRFGWTLAYAAILCVAAYGFGLPDVPRVRQQVLGASVGAPVAGAIAISLIQLFVGDALLPRFVVFGAALILPDWFHLCVRLTSGSRRRAEAKDRVLVIASPGEVADLEAELRGSPERPAVIVASIDVADAVEHSDRRPIADRAATCKPTVVVLDRRAQDEPSIVAQVAALHEHGLRVRTLTGFYEDWLTKLPMAELERASLLFDISEVHRATYGRGKRILDLALALLGLVALVLVIPFVWVLDRARNQGPLFFSQPRIGKGGTTFTIIKFRTMRPDVDRLVDEWTQEDDPRITPFGKMLRRTHLDELPQVVNVIRGDLAIVGPRPEQPAYVSDLRDKLPFYDLRHLVRPGLTGWAQVKHGYAGDERDALEKLQYDFWYLRHQSWRLDVRIVGRTLRSFFGAQGR